jgi:hypothetical protein
MDECDLSSAGLFGRRVGVPLPVLLRDGRKCYKRNRQADERTLT